MNLGHIRKQTAHLPDSTPVLLNQVSSAVANDSGDDIPVSVTIADIAPSADNQYLMVHVDVVSDVEPADDEEDQ